MKYEVDTTPDPLCDIEAEVRTGTHAVNTHPAPRVSHERSNDEKQENNEVQHLERTHSHKLPFAHHSAPNAALGLPAHTLTLTLSRSSARSRSGSVTGPRGEAAVGFTPLPPPPDSPLNEKDIEGPIDEATTAVGEEVNKDIYEDPGLWGWLDCLGAVLVNMLCYGMTQSWGVFQQYYATHTLNGSTGMSISWIGAVQFALCPMLGCISGPLFDAGYLKHLLVIGGGLYSFCFMMASISTQYYQVLLSHGIGVGLGMGIMFSPSVSTLQHHFSRSRYRTLAYGFQASGSAIAGICFPALLNYLLPKVGFGWTMRIFGFIVIVFTIAAVICLSTTIPPRKEIAVLSPAVFRNPSYSIYVAGVCFASLSIYAPQTFAVTYATYRGMQISLANYTVTISNGVSLVGRILPLFFAQRLGPINVLATAGMISGVTQMLWTLARTTPAILAYSAMYGIPSGAYGASVNPGAASFAPHTNQSGLYLGMCFFSSSFFWLAGTPITAQLIDSSGYLPASMYTGCAVLLGAACIFVSRVVRAKQVGTQWV